MFNRFYLIYLLVLTTLHFGQYNLRILQFQVWNSAMNISTVDPKVFSFGIFHVPINRINI